MRLGELDLGSDNETYTVDIPVIKVARHPGYSKKDKRNDLAILYLENAVEFSSKFFLSKLES